MVTLPGLSEILTSGVSWTVALARVVLSARLVAVIVTVCFALIVAGATYAAVPPADVKVPICGASDQDTPELVVPLTVAENRWTARGFSVMAAGLIDTVIAALAI